MQVTLVVLSALLLVSQVALWAVLFQVVKQQGRLLLRLDALGQRQEELAPGPGANGFAPATEQGQPAGLPVGTPIAPFALPDLEGRSVGLSNLAGNPALLIHWSTQCGFCDMIAPNLARLQPALQTQNVQLVLISSGEAEANRQYATKHGLTGPILLQDVTQGVECFQGLGTPVAYLLDAQGQVQRPLAWGADQVMTLARETASAPAARPLLPGNRPLSLSRIEREGLKVGTPAPPFRLPDVVHGRTVALDAYRGREVVLVFSDPHCGPCDQLATQLARLQREQPDADTALLMVGRGAAEDNRRKAVEHGIEFPVVRQERWDLSKRYGIFATPVAFLIDRDGRIARDVARGTDEILALAQETLATGKAGHDGRAVR